MGNKSSRKQLSKIPVAEQPYMFLNGKIKLCKVLEVNWDSSFKKALIFKSHNVSK